MIEARADHHTIVRLTDGEDLIAGLLGMEATSAVILCGIGMLRDLELGFWNQGRYEKHRIESAVELVSLQGNIARLDDDRVAHVHACVAKRDGSTAGGHLFAATVHNTVEMALVSPPGLSLERRAEETGLTGLYPRAS